MQSNCRPTRCTSLPQLACAAVWLVTASQPGALVAGPTVVFDFARRAECRDVTPSERAEDYPDERLLEIELLISVRFHGVAVSHVEQIDINVDGSTAGLRVHDFSPATQLASDVLQAIETTTTTKRSRSLEGTLGGALPVPAAELVAHVAPSISAAAARSEVATEKTSRLPPKHAVVVSGTSHEGQGVFFTLKRSTQTSLEGVHELKVVFVAPAEWDGGGIRVACGARGRRQVLWLEQSKSLGGVTATVELYRQGNLDNREAVAQRVEAADAQGPATQPAQAAADPTDAADHDDTVQADEPAGDEA